MKNRKYYVATDLINMESGIFTTMRGCSEFLYISVDTIRRGLKGKNRLLKENRYLIYISTISKSKNKGNAINFSS